MKIPIYQLDAFSSRVFGGNPAAVCPLERWLDDGTLQAIAAENNLSETAFFVPSENPLRIRWFTPLKEVDLCGHATLASGSIYLETLSPGAREVTFESRSGPLTVKRDGELLVMDFPAWPAKPCQPPAALAEALGAHAMAWLKTRDYMAVFAGEDEVRSLAPDMGVLASFSAVIATAPGKEADFVSRFFAPSYGIPEDPVTGSAHSTLTPYWSARLKKKKLRALQVSKRGGELFCEDRGERVTIAGRAVRFLDGTITIP